ncbi:MAG TPA: gephyrin-like molybdotransferase Glp, partial [Myxococcota bacterium]|nr:gephyrin-like molybdotransferase Glp [Myxococcota bacterium]
MNELRTGLSVAEAQRVVLALAPQLGSETVASADALGRILAERVVSTRTLPPADNSAMDGYAIRSADLGAATAAAPVALRVVFEVAAGSRPERALAPGEAARIFTGAPIPPGADSVVKQEDTEREGGLVRVRVAPRKGENVRAAGEDVGAGDLVFESGAELGPAALGLLASLGRSVVAVHQRPRVAVVSGGDELIEPDRALLDGKIVSSNSYTLSAQCRLAGAEPIYLGIARDAPEALEERLLAGSRADLIVSSGGVSVGDRDYVRPVLEKLGCRLIFWGVEMKPGYPIVFGRFGETGPLVFGLPGNPVSAMVTFEQFVRPALRKMAGHKAWFRPVIRATLADPFEKAAGRMHFVRVSLEPKADAPGEFVARSTGSQSSGALRSMALAQGLLILPAAHTRLRAGEHGLVQVLDEGFFASRE